MVVMGMARVKHVEHPMEWFIRGAENLTGGQVHTGNQLELCNISTAIND